MNSHNNNDERASFEWPEENEDELEQTLDNMQKRINRENAIQADEIKEETSEVTNEETIPKDIETYDLLPIPLMRRNITVIAFRLTINGAIESSNQSYDLKYSPDLAKDEKTNQGVNYIDFEGAQSDLVLLLNPENIKNKTGIQDEKELKLLSKTCGKIFFSLLKNYLLATSEDCSTTMKRLLQYDVAFLERVALLLQDNNFSNRNLKDVLSTALGSVEQAFSDEIHSTRVLPTDVLNVVTEKLNLPKVSTIFSYNPLPPNPVAIASSRPHPNKLFTLKIGPSKELPTKEIESPSPK